MGRRETPTVAACMQAYIESNTGTWVRNTVNNNRSVLTKFVEGVGKDRYGEDRPIGNVTAMQVERWFVEYVSPNNPANASFNKVRTMVVCFLRYCEQHGWVHQNLTQHVKPRPRIHKERMHLSGPELVALLGRVTDPRDHAVLLTGMNSGLRSSEITAIKVGHINFDDGELSIHRQKSKSDDRIGITSALEDELRSWLRYYANSIDEPLTDDMWLFPARFPPRWDGDHEPGQERVCTLGDLRPHHRLTKAHRIVQRALRDAGHEVTFQEGIHTLRRSAARQFFEFCSEQGHDAALRSTAALLGHRSVTTTEIYLGLSADRMKRDKMLKGQNFLPFDAVEKVTKLRSADG